MWFTAGKGDLLYYLLQNHSGIYGSLLSACIDIVYIILKRVKEKYLEKMTETPPASCVQHRAQFNCPYIGNY